MQLLHYPGQSAVVTAIKAQLSQLEGGGRGTLIIIISYLYTKLNMPGWIYEWPVFMHVC